MRELVFLLAGVIVGGVLNLGVQLTLRHLDEVRARRLAARVIYGELMEFGFLQINSTTLPPGAGDGVHAAWREHRAALVKLSRRDWDAIEAAVMDAVYPHTKTPVPESTNNALELALVVLEPHAGLPRDRHAFT